MSAAVAGQSGHQVSASWLNYHDHYPVDLRYAFSVHEDGAPYSFVCLAGLYPDTWPLPLSVHGMASALTNPVPQPMMAVDANGAPVMAMPPANAGASGGRKRSAEGAAVRLCRTVAT